MLPLETIYLHMHQLRALILLSFQLFLSIFCFAQSNDFYKLALAEKNVGQWQTALVYVKQSMEGNKKNADALLLCGLCKYELKDYNGAIIDLDEALLLNKEMPEAYKIRGDAKYELGMYLEAIIDFSSTITLDKKFTLAYFDRGLSYLKLKDYCYKRF